MSAIKLAPGRCQLQLPIVDDLIEQEREAFALLFSYEPERCEECDAVLDVLEEAFDTGATFPATVYVERYGCPNSECKGKNNDD